MNTKFEMVGVIVLKFFMFLFDYQGWLKENVSLKDMIEEVTDIAEIYNWEYQIFEDTLPPEDYFTTKRTAVLYGMSVTPPDSETVWLTFYCNGEMIQPHRPDADDDPETEPIVQYVSRLIDGSRQEGVDIHKKVINLLRYLKPKYFTALSVIDISDYWETGDEQLMDKILRVYDSYYEAMNYSQDFPARNGETEDAFMARTVDFVFRKNKNNTDNA